MRWHSFAAIALIAAALLPRTVLAAQLKDFSVKDEGKKARVTFSFSEKVKAEVISHYANNFVALSIGGLGFSKAQTKADHKAESKALETVYRYIRCVPGAKAADPGEIRVYLAKPVTPADALVIQNGSSIEIEILKPRGSATGAPEPEDQAWPSEAPPPSTPTPPTENHGTNVTAPPEEPAPAEAEPAEAGPEAPAEESADSNPPAVSGDSTEAAPADGGGHTPLGQLPGGSKPHPPVKPPAEEPPPAEEEPGGSVDILPSGRSYQSFDLTQVPVNGVEIKNEPFNQALMELVAGTGFNVVVGAGVSTETVTLNFSKKQISLKSALDLLCVAYNLDYTVEDDGIVIKGKPEQ